MKGRWEKIIFILVLLFLVLSLMGTATADNVQGGVNLTTIQNGTVSGDLYTDTYLAKTASQNVTYNFQPLPENAQVVWAQLSTTVYCGSMTQSYNGYVNTTFNGQQIGYEFLNTSYTIPVSNNQQYWLNDHVNRVTSDYLIFYDVTSLIQQNNMATVITTDADSNFDGQIKFINLIIAYNDGDSDLIQYWVNLGHDRVSSDDPSYLGVTVFNGNVSGVVDVATAQVIHLASNDGSYTFNGNNIQRGNPQGAYCGMNTWDVTGLYSNTGINTLTYDNMESYYKIILATLIVKYHEVIDLKPGQLEVPGTVFTNQNTTVNITITNQGAKPADAFQVTFTDNGSEVARENVNSLEGYGNILLSFKWNPTVQGSHFLQILVDGVNIIAESDETNNQINQTVMATILATPDLSPSNLNLPSLIYAGDTYQVNVTVINTGTAKTSFFTVQLEDEGTVIAQEIVDYLNIGETKLLIFNWKPLSTGLHNLKVIIDSLYQVEESNEFNNDLIKLLNVELKRPDLVVDNLTIPSDPQVNHTYQLNADISNIGIFDAGTFIVELYDVTKNGSTLVRSITVDGLIEGATVPLQFGWKPTSNGSHTLKILIDTGNQVNESNETNNQLNRYVIMNNASVINIFMISNLPGTNVLNMAAQSILDKFQGTVSIQLRNSEQVEAMSEDELRAYLAACDIFIGEWISSDGATLFSNVLNKYPEVAYKENGVFLILEPPISTTSSSVALMRYSTINGVRILENLTDDDLLDYYDKTKMGQNYTNVSNYMGTVNFPNLYNIATLYKDLNNKDSIEDQILWALNIIGVETQFELPSPSPENQDYGIYRYRWYTLEEYKATYFKSWRQGTVGLIEYSTYIESEMLQTYYAIIESLEAQGLNVIPVTADGADPDQLEIMVQAFTNASDYQSFIANPTAYAIYVDSIVEMAAYGLGGDAFTEVINFLSELNVPVVRAIHSDYMTNEQWELESTGLPTDDGSKWWHVAILEAQGIIEYTFVGGKSTKVDPDTGASIEGYVPQEENIEYMTKRVASWVKLQYMDNADKLVALIYYNYPPGKDNIGSSYLDTVTSIYNLLKVMEAEGYTVENIPTSATALEELMITLGINVANWAPGELQKLVDNPNIILYPVSDYLEWFSQLDEITRLQVTEGPIAYIGELCKRAVQLNYTADMSSKIDTWYSGVISLLPENQSSTALPILNNIVSSLKDYILSHSISDYNIYLNYKEQFLALKINGTTGWGEAPGNIMVVQKGGIQYFVIPGLKFGNIFIGPEPQRGWEGDVAKLYHSSVVAPPHQYLAYYAYLQEHGTNAMVFMGRHATHEWLPGKELVLSPNDFPSVVVGTVPQIYFYIVDGLAEGIQAKRRGYAVIISHLTPPMTFTSLYGDLGKLATLADQYDGATSAQQAEIITQIKSLISNNHYDLGLDISTLNNNALIAALEDYLDDIQSTLYPYGLHSIGQAWNESEIALLVTSILSVEFEITNSTETTTLHDEISQIMNGKPYNSLTALEKEKVQEKCVDVVVSLICWDENTVANMLSSTPSANLIFTLQMAEYYIWAINQSIENEVTSFLNALNGGYIMPGAGGDPVANPDVLPTGTNFYDDQAAEIPTKEAYEYAKILTLLALADITDDTEKIAMGIWCVETARDDGALVSLVLYLLGMKPDWSDSPSAGVDGQKLKEMPIYVELADLARPAGWDKKRIDVTIITSGLFRDLYSRQSQLMDNAFRVALARSYFTIINNAVLKAKYGSQLNTALDTIMEGIGYYGLGSESLSYNYVAKHWVEDFEYYMSLNMTSEVAGEMAITRIFAPPEGDYGAGISHAVSQSWTWEDRMELGKFYLNRMANMYSHNNWGTNNAVVFSRALSGIGTVFTSRNTNLYGVLDNDDFFDYWGGLSIALEYVNGNAPNMYVLDYSDRSDPDSISLEQYINRELTTRYYNPSWIKGMMNEGYSGARYLSKKFVSNLLGWQMTRPGSIKNWMWDKVVDVYLRDSYNLGVTEFLSSGNNAYSMISMTGTLLTAAYEGYWTTDKATLQLVANTWAQMVVTNGVACCDCSCGNLAMMKWASTYINADLLAQVNAQLYQATQQSQFAPGQTPQSNPTGSTSVVSQSSSSDSSSESQTSGESGSSTAGDEESESATSPGEEGKAYEVSEQSSSGSSESGLPIAAVAGVIVLVALVGIGYYRGNKKGK